MGNENGKMVGALLIINSQMISTIFLFCVTKARHNDAFEYRLILFISVHEAFKSIRGVSTATLHKQNMTLHHSKWSFGTIGVHARDCLCCEGWLLVHAWSCQFDNECVDVVSRWNKWSAS